MKSEEERIAALEKALAEAHLKLLVHEKIIEVASKKYKVDHKTFGPQASSRPEEKPPPMGMKALWFPIRFSGLERLPYGRPKSGCVLQASAAIRDDSNDLKIYRALATIGAELLS